MLAVTLDQPANTVRTANILGIPEALILRFKAFFFLRNVGIVEYVLC